MKILFILDKNTNESLKSLSLLKKMKLNQFESVAFSLNDVEDKIKKKFCKFYTQKSFVSCYDVANITILLSKLQSMEKFDLIIFPNTFIYKMVAPRLATRLQTGLTAEVIDIEYKNKILYAIRPAFSGQIYASVSNTKTKPIIISVMLESLESVKHTKVHKCESLTFDVELPKSKVKLISANSKTENFHIEKSKYLLSCGDGINDNLEKVKDICCNTSFDYCGSRKMIDKGLLDRTRQIGQSGKIVTPKLYIALGISGAIQHIMGMKKSEFIISINKDVKSPMSKISHICIKSDCNEFIDKLHKKIIS